MNVRTHRHLGVALFWILWIALGRMLSGGGRHRHRV